MAASYVYDREGMRAQKTVGSAVTNYHYNGKLLMAQTTGNASQYYNYDANGNLIAIYYNNAYYYYLRNGQGDIVGLLDSTKTLVVSYTYDAWGKLLSMTGTLATTLGVDNPFRYRGYYYDTETGLYYLQSRYYDPEVGRFLNCDVYASTGQGILGCNQYAYVLNNPIALSDPSGRKPKWFGRVTDTGTGTPTYTSADWAAAAFAASTYSSTAYARHEYGAEVYSKEINGVSMYYYTTPRPGGPHNADVNPSNAPAGTTCVAVVHTHPNSNRFSGSSPGDRDGDIPYANRHGVDIYVAGPNLMLQRYTVADGTTHSLWTISPITLTSADERRLAQALEVSWRAHFDSDGICPRNFGCENKTWPNS